MNGFKSFGIWFYSSLEVFRISGFCVLRFVWLPSDRKCLHSGIFIRIILLTFSLDERKRLFVSR